MASPVCTVGMQQAAEGASPGKHHSTPTLLQPGMTVCPKSPSPCGTPERVPATLAPVSPHSALSSCQPFQAVQSSSLFGCSHHPAPSPGRTLVSLDLTSSSLKVSQVR